MNLKTLVVLKSNPYMGKYLQEHSYFYKYLNRNQFSIKELEKRMKEEYKMTAIDKIENVGRKIEFIQSFIDLLN